MKQQLTHHAKKRMQQRCISNMQLQLIELFGDKRYQKGGTEESFLPDKAIRDLRRAIDKIGGLLVVSSSTAVITAMHTPRRLRVMKLKR